MSANQIIYIINQTPAYLAIWRQLDNDGKRLALEMADGEVSLLDIALEDALDIQGAK